MGFEGGRLGAVYDLIPAPGEEAEAKARDVAYEQTVELPEACVPAGVAARAAGRVESVHPLEDGCWRARISYPLDIAGDDLGQILNLLFGNVSMKGGIRLAAVEWPPKLLAALTGPAHGIAGLRRLCGVGDRRPLLCAALKPVGLALDGLVERCRQFALAGVDLVKDDHSLADPPTAPFAERVARCQEAVEEANRTTGASTRYFPLLAAQHSDLEARLETIRRAGCRGVVTSPLLLGLETVRSVAAGCELAILGHPSLAGAYFGSAHGIAPEILLGELFRLAGCDGVIYPNAGGRFLLGLEACEAINRALRAPLGAIRPAFPVPGGGIQTDRVLEWTERYGPDVVFLIGGSLYLEPNLRAAAASLAAALRDSTSGPR